MTALSIPSQGELLRNLPANGPRHGDRLDADYRQLSLVDLVRRIACDGDSNALREFHNHRTIFRWRGGEVICFIEHVDRLVQQSQARTWCGFDPLVLEQARDLTVAKFSNLPPDARTRDEGTLAPMKRHGPDCRCYFMAFLRHASKRLRNLGAVDELERDELAAKCLQGLVRRHFYLSCLECRRRAAGPVTRYFWSTGSGTLCLWMPSQMSGARRRTWLETHVADADPRRPGERQRVQEIIRQGLPQPSRISLDAAAGQRSQMEAMLTPDEAFTLRDVSTKGLAEAVAQEKGHQIARQRQAIRALGRQKLVELIRTIFADLTRGEYEDGRIARTFGLSRATLSRFAGSRWARLSGDGNKAAVPDLWRNTAQVLSQHEPFVQAAQEAGVWTRVTQILATRQHGDGGCHE